MNGKKARKLRREAEAKTIGQHPEATRKIYQQLKRRNLGAK